MEDTRTDFCGTHTWVCGLCTEETKRLDAFVAEHVRSCRGLVPVGNLAPYRVEIRMASIGQVVSAVCDCDFTQDLTHAEHA